MTNIFDRVKALKLPKGEYVIIGGGVMEALGLRLAGDIDIAVTQKLHEQLRATGEWDEVELYGKIFLQKDGIEINPEVSWPGFSKSAEEIIAEATMIEGVPFMNLRHLREFKQALGREKDLKDLALLDEYEKT